MRRTQQGGTGSDALPDEAYMVALASLDRVGPATFRWLVSHGSPASVWARVLSRRLSPGPGARVEREQIQRWAAQAASMDVDALWRHCQERRIEVLLPGSANYPQRLADDIDPPAVLFRRGASASVCGPTVAVVGTRRPTAYGRQVAGDLGRALTEAGVTVISGLALGIDAAAHRGAIEAIRSKGSVGAVSARPVAVVGSNLESPCPQPNRRLADQIVEFGTLLSEVPPHVASAPWRFPVRNRVIAALCDVLVVVESAANGGSMHTVREALDRDRAVLAVPGPIGCVSSEGTNQLLRDGAAPCLGVDDILMEVGFGGSGAEQQSLLEAVEPIESSAVDIAAASTAQELTEKETSLLASLGWEPLTFESLAARAALAPRELAIATAALEAGGWVRRNGPWVERIRR